jgi:LmbE family N-acetylglucosaminyl deacetylase
MKMDRKKFIVQSLMAGTFMPFVAQAKTLGVPSSLESSNTPPKAVASAQEEVYIERPQSGKPHQGKVLAAIQPHCDDIPIFAGGTVAKLIQEGYTGYMIRTSNDDAAGRGATVGVVIRNNEIANEATSKVLGMKKVYDLGYRNHRMEEYNIQELKARLIFLFRLLKVDTILCYDPWGHYEENPDHYVTAKAVEAACWQSGSKDYPEQLEVVAPHAVKEKYYFARGPQRVNRIVDYTPYVDIKVQSNVVIKSQGPGGDAGARLRKSLADQGKKIPLLGQSDQAANYNYVKHFMLDRDSQYLRGVVSDREVGKKYGVEWGEAFHYIGPRTTTIDQFIQNK